MSDKDIVVAQEKADGDFEETTITPSEGEGLLAFGADGYPEVKGSNDLNTSVKLGNLTLFASRPDNPADGDMWAQDDGYIYFCSGGNIIKFE